MLKECRSSCLLYRQMNGVRDPLNVMHEACLDLGNGMMYVIALSLRVL